MTETANCKGCRGTVQLAPAEVERILSDYFRGQAFDVVDDTNYAKRLKICGACPDLVYRTTCKHCGCLVAVRAKLADKACPAPLARWNAT